MKRHMCRGETIRTQLAETLSAGNPLRQVFEQRSGLLFDI
jgi:hypothetical protein